MERLIICVTVGYMLKVLKSNKNITTYKKEFDAIRHGDYIKFIDFIKGPIPFLSTYNKGIITSGFIPPQENDISFALLIKAGPSLIIFYKNCKSKYGEIYDSDINDKIFETLALFEINLRMHANNYKLITVNDLLIDVIIKLGKFKNISEDDMIKIQQGRKFLNMVKHMKNQFKSWDEGISALETAFETLNKYDLGADI